MTTTSEPSSHSTLAALLQAPRTPTKHKPKMQNTKPLVLIGHPIQRRKMVILLFLMVANKAGRDLVVLLVDLMLLLHGDVEKPLIETSVKTFTAHKKHGTSLTDRASIQGTSSGITARRIKTRKIVVVLLVQSGRDPKEVVQSAVERGVHLGWQLRRLL